MRIQLDESLPSDLAALLTGHQTTAVRKCKRMPRILAIGGGSILMEDTPSPIDRLLLQLTTKRKPRICYIGTPSGDMQGDIEKFYAAFPADRCQPSHLAFFREPSAGSFPLATCRQQLMHKDAIFVGGGNTKSAFGVWSGGCNTYWQKRPPREYCSAV